MMLLCGRECCVEFKCRKFNFWLNQREFYTKSLHDLYNIHGWRAHPHIFILSLALSFYLSLSLFFPFRLSFSLSPLSLSLARSVLFFFFFKYHGNWVLTYSVLKLLVISCDLLKICPLAPRSHLVVFRNNFPHIQIGQVFIPSHEYPRRIYIIAYSATCEISEIGFSGRVSVLRPTSLSL